MRHAVTFWMTGIFWSMVLFPGLASADVFETRASDSAVKMIRFPQSLAVIHNRPGEKLFFLDLEEMRTSFLPQEMFDPILSDQKTLKRTLGKIDPARIVPVTLGKDVIGPMNRETLDALGKQYNVDILLVFRRELRFFTPGLLKLRNRGLVYLVRQKKLLVVPSNESAVTYEENEFDEKVGEMNERGLKQLAEDTRKVIMSHKFEKRRSNY